MFFMNSVVDCRKDKGLCSAAGATGNSDSFRIDIGARKQVVPVNKWHLIDKEENV